MIAYFLTYSSLLAQILIQKKNCSVYEGSTGLGSSITVNLTLFCIGSITSAVFPQLFAAYHIYWSLNTESSCCGTGAGSNHWFLGFPLHLFCFASVFCLSLLLLPIYVCLHFFLCKGYDSKFKLDFMNVKTKTFSFGFKDRQGPSDCSWR